MVGPLFYGLHRLCFFLGVPALANILLTRGGKSVARKWYYIPLACAFLGFALVILEYNVTEALYGVEGYGGPFGTAPPF
jgi:hypothetical protein